MRNKSAVEAIMREKRFELSPTDIAFAVDYGEETAEGEVAATGDAAPATSLAGAAARPRAQPR